MRESAKIWVGSSLGLFGWLLEKSQGNIFDGGLLGPPPPFPGRKMS